MHLMYDNAVYVFLANMVLQLVYILFWGVAVMVTLAYVYKHGEEFVNQPKLVKTE